MPCTTAASDRIQLSVRPGIGMSRKASGTPASSSNARAIARPPAPPVSTSVPSMSKRMTCWVTTGRRLNVRPQPWTADELGPSMLGRRAAGPVEGSGGFAANVPRARPLGRWLFLETDALAFVQLVETALDRTPVEEPLLPAVVADEAKTPVP